MSDGVKIPLRDRKGSARAFVVVDAADVDWVNQWKWSLSVDGYAKRCGRVDGRARTILLHRELLGLPRVYDGRKGDHIDRDHLNCRRANLRAVPGPANGQNRSNTRGSSSPHRGVSWDSESRKWKAQLQLNGKNINLGRFDDESRAAEVVRAGRLRLMPYAVD